MTDKIINSTIEILGKFYPVRCAASEIESLQEAAEYLNQKMLEVQETGKVINSERIFIVTALNIAHELLQTNKQKISLANCVKQRINQLQDKLDNAINKPAGELVYSTE